MFVHGIGHAWAGVTRRSGGPGRFFFPGTFLNLPDEKEFTRDLPIMPAVVGHGVKIFDYLQQES